MMNWTATGDLLSEARAMARHPRSGTTDQRRKVKSVEMAAIWKVRVDANRLDAAVVEDRASRYEPSSRRRSSRLHATARMV
jgi:hypothetical protein